MIHHIDLYRKFRDLRKDELEQPEILAYLNESSSTSAVGWTELLTCPRVLLLAEAGAGKTMEMRAQAARLMAEGKPAFFIPLESLYHNSLASHLSAHEKAALEGWRCDAKLTAWFFLDAVDELKLTRGRLDYALLRLANESDGLLHRMHIVISCRPYDWRPAIDMATFMARLPFTPPKVAQPINSDEIFLAPLRPQADNGQADTQEVGTKDVPRVVVLLPLSELQIVSFARSLGISDTTTFIAEIRRRDAWTFARRPLDLLELVAYWKVNGRLGNRTEQHAANIISKLKDSPDRADSGRLTDDRARLGAERLALALALTHTRTIRSPEQPLDADLEGVLNPAEILTDWTEEERQALLRRGLFDPATYGRIRFHHRSVQEYLAACRLWVLRNDKGMPAKNLHRLLFAERYGVPLVLPSKQAIAAWLALWDSDVRRELMNREPETLFSMGDPESLSIDARTQLLKEFFRAYSKGGWRGFDIPADQIGRLADPHLSAVIRDLWTGSESSSPDVTELLLEIIWHGAIADCLDIARAAAFSLARSETERVIAVRGLIACDDIEALRDLGSSIIGEPDKWPDRVVQAVVGDLFPDVLTTPDLINLIQRSQGLRGRSNGFTWPIRKIAETIEPLSTAAAELRDSLAGLIWSNRHSEQDWYNLTSRFGDFSLALAILCDKQIQAGARAPISTISEAGLVWACVVASRFSSRGYEVREEVDKLRKRFEADPSLRQIAFWGEIKLMSEAVPAQDLGDLYFRSMHRGMLEPLTAGDRPWLLAALQESSNADQRVVALHGLIDIWRSRRDEDERAELFTLVHADPVLADILKRKTSPSELDPKLEAWQQQERESRLERERRQEEGLEEWLRWKRHLLADPEGAFAPGEIARTTRSLYRWLEMQQSSRTHHAVWDTKALEQAFNNDIAERAAKAFQSTWRMNTPLTRSQRPEGERNTILLVWAEGLTGLAVEADNPGWATRLSNDEARLAAVYSTIEINGFPNWLRDLAAAHPDVVEAVIGGELTAELSADNEASLTLQYLSHAHAELKKLLEPRLIAMLPAWPSDVRDGTSGRETEHHLRQILMILDSVTEERKTLSQLCRTRFMSNPRGTLALAWLRGLFRFNTEVATHSLETTLTSLPQEDRPAYAINVFADLFGDRDSTLLFADEATRAVSLGRLVRCAYFYVKPDEDHEHEGAYTPDLRDRAETGRNYLLSTLLDTPGAEARKALLALATDPVFSHYPDRLRLLVRQRAALDAEGPPLTTAEVVMLERQLEAPPSDRDSLFTVMIDRIDDLTHDIAHDDFTDRRTLQTIEDEIEMQRTLALRLRSAARGIYVVSREDEVADRKRTDIRLAATRGNQKVVIEVKIADRWSLAELEDALRSQLVGQYLRHDTCKAGCLLLTYHGKKRFWEDSRTGARLNFNEVVEQLRSSALEVEVEMGYDIRLAVRSINLTEASEPTRQ